MNTSLPPIVFVEFYLYKTTKITVAWLVHDSPLHMDGHGIIMRMRHHVVLVTFLFPWKSTMRKTTYKRRHLIGAYSFKVLVPIATMEGDMHTWLEPAHMVTESLFHPDSWAWDREREKNYLGIVWSVETSRPTFETYFLQ